MKLKDALPFEFMQGEFDDTRAMKMADVEVVREGSGPWIGNQKYVYSWYILANGYAVGHNENPNRGWSFPVMKMSKEVTE